MVQLSSAKSCSGARCKPLLGERYFHHLLSAASHDVLVSHHVTEQLLDAPLSCSYQVQDLNFFSRL